ncbi:MAG: type II toxin-antitoxin system RelE/ParE family toxin [Deltaproteobacteria bacterium]|nr:type II toxin-antitoxin system RelE/ParE family toxin [Deltaproteobacteria bacterium]
MSTVTLYRHAANYLKRLPKDSKNQIKDVLKQLEDNPLTHSGIKEMFGEWAGYHRMRAGKLRIIFWFDAKEDIVYDDHIGPRGDVYK